MCTEAEMMSMTETANMLEILMELGWSGEQIMDFQLGIAGRISIKESATRIKSQNKP